LKLNENDVDNKKKRLDFHKYGVLMLPGRALPDFSLGSCSPVKLDSSIERPLGEKGQKRGES
jgi:hypothetical protein